MSIVPPGIVPLDPPPDGYDATAERDPAQLARFGFPTRPGAEDDPAALAFWADSLGPHIHFELPFGSDFDVSAGTIGSRPPEEMVGGLVGPWLTSRNWSGVIKAPISSWRFAGAMGRWRVPAIRLPAGAPREEHRCSIWLGLDGLRRRARAVPQIGTEHIVGADGKVTHGAWVQWFAEGKGVPQGGLGPYPITGFPLAPNDDIRGFVSLVDAQRVGFALSNRTQGVAVLIRLESGTLANPAAFHLAGSTAEWILERPSVLTTAVTPPPFYPLADFGEVALQPIAVETLANIPHPGDPPAPRRFLAPGAAKEVAMFETRSAPERVRLLARPAPRAPVLRLRYVG